MTASRHPVQNVEKKRLPIRAVHIWHGGFFPLALKTPAEVARGAPVKH